MHPIDKRIARKVKIVFSDNAGVVDDKRFEDLCDCAEGCDPGVIDEGRVNETLERRAGSWTVSEAG